MFVFITWTCCCVAMTGHVEVGLDVQQSLPEDSYLLEYVQVLASTVKLGPTVQFVVEDGYDYSTLDGQNMICAGPGCREDSLLGQIFKASQNPSRHTHSTFTFIHCQQVIIN